MQLLKNICYAALIITLCGCSKSADFSIVNNVESLPAEQSTDRLGGCIFGNCSKTFFGVLSEDRDMSIRLTAAINLTVKYVRESVILSAWKGHDKSVDTWLNNGYKVVLNINNDFLPSPFPTNLVAYEKKLRSVLNMYHPEVVVIENEELNTYDRSSPGSNFHTGSLVNYIKELAVAVRVCRDKNLLVTNGGLTNPVVSSLYNYYVTNNKQDSAQWLSLNMGGVSRDPVKARRADTLLRAYKELALSFVNLHWYEPVKEINRMTGVLPVLIDYITQQTGKKVITNETGVKTSNSTYVTKLMKQWDDASTKYVMFYDSNGVGAAGAYPLTTRQGILVANGIAFKNYNLTH